MRWLTLACLLTGCVPVPVHGPQTILHHSLVNYAPQLLDRATAARPMITNCVLPPQGRVPSSLANRCQI